MAQLTIDPEVDEYDDVLALLDVLYGRESDNDEDLDEDDDSPNGSDKLSDLDLSAPIDGFTQKRMNRYVQNLTPEGQLILQFIATNAPTVAMDDVQHNAGKYHAEYAGTMSTFGHAVNKTKGVTGIPFTKHDRVYRINPKVAEMALTALERLGI